MRITDSKKTYKAPKAKVVEVNVQGVLCGSPYGENTENFTIGNSYGEDDWN